MKLSSKIASCVTLFALYSYANNSQTDEYASSFLEWQQNWTEIPYYNTRPLGGMSSTRSDKANFPFMLGPTGIYAKMSRTTLVYEIVEIDALSPAQGQVQVGDTITGVNGILFADAGVPDGYPDFVGPNVQMGRAILDSMKNHDGEVTLTISRNNRTITASVVIPGNCDFGDNFPEQSTLADTWIDVGCEILAARQLDNGGWSKGNEGGKDRNTASDLHTCLAGLALMASGDAKWDNAIERAAINITKSELPTNFQTWKCAYRMIFLGEYYLRTNDSRVLAHLQECVDLQLKGAFFYGGYGHSTHTGNYRGNGINICTTHAFLGYAYAELCGCDVPEEHLNSVMDQILRSREGNGGIPYGIWHNRRNSRNTNRADKDDASNTRNEHAARNGTAWLGFYLLGYDDNNINSLADFLSHNSDYMDNGHATGNTLSWLWGSAALQVANPDAFSEHMQRRDWWIALHRRYDGTTMPQPAECVNFRSGDKMLAAHADIATQTIVLAATRQQLLITGKESDHIPATRALDNHALVDLATWDTHAEHARHIGWAAAILGARTPDSVAAYLDKWNALEVDDQETYAAEALAIKENLLSDVLKDCLAVANEDEANTIAQLVTGFRFVLNSKRKTNRNYSCSINVENLPFGELSIDINEAPTDKNFLNDALVANGIIAPEKIRSQHCVLDFDLLLTRRPPESISLPINAMVTWEDIAFNTTLLFQQNIAVEKYAYAGNTPLLTRIPATVISWNKAGAALNIGGERMTFCTHQLGALTDGNNREKIDHQTCSQMFPEGSNVLIDVYYNSAHKPFIHLVTDGNE